MEYTEFQTCMLGLGLCTIYYPREAIAHHIKIYLHVHLLYDTTNIMEIISYCATMDLIV